ncbi:hypothetical protein [Borreliella lusitaniae]|uniref:hypothetical protein n=1 Tax=Borreliella lusitaniae TaxID=100177 RepID=UPI003AB3F51E
MNKKMFIICALFVLISSCKTDESKEEKSLENILDDIGLEVEKLVQADEAPKQAGNKDGGAGGAGAGAAGAGAAGGAGGAGAGGGAAGGAGAAGAGAGVGGVGGAGAGAAGDNIKKKIEDLKKKIEKADPKKTSLTTYSTYEGELKKIREELQGNGNAGNDAELKQLEESLKTKKDDRKKELEKSKNKFEDFKKQVAAATGQTYGDQVQNKGKIGQQAFFYAKQLGLTIDTSKNSDDTKELVNQVINGAIKKIQEELEGK